ncbi:hypothetical protein HX798_01115 [Pseudomonas putida]|uniref:Uncharacterized protein n=1 Tax=Pseudomonas putida TaxID=303 RepID=A0A7Y7Z6Z3_PSEPU|nr:hypothetical protein [Pseudomonas putida]NWC78883.1 hypothetical protein [Pseudomonas putida]
MNTKQPVQAMFFGIEELQKRQDKSRQRYLTGYMEHGSFRFPATEMFDFPRWEDALDFVEKMAKAGRQRYTLTPIQTAIWYIGLPYYKEQGILDQELSEFDTAVEAGYRQEINSFNDLQKSLLAEQLLHAELDKEKKKEEDRLAKLRAKAEHEENECFRSATEQNK